MKNGGKNKSVAFIIFSSVCVNVSMCIHVYVYVNCNFVNCNFVLNRTKVFVFWGWCPPGSWLPYANCILCVWDRRY